MVTQNLKKIFLSASIPYSYRDKKFYDTADIIAIRDSVRALATVVIPNAHLIWGGHPSITPLIRYVMGTMKAELKAHVTLYQSQFFEDRFLKDNFSFENIILTARRKSLEESLEIMREKLMRGNDFKAGIFIGGMEGVMVEYEMFKQIHPYAIMIPVASTGAAAKNIYDSMDPRPDRRLQTDYAYMDLFRRLFNQIIN